MANGEAAGDLHQLSSVGIAGILQGEKYTGIGRKNNYVELMSYLTLGNGRLNDVYAL